MIVDDRVGVLKAPNGRASPLRSCRECRSWRDRAVRTVPSAWCPCATGHRGRATRSGVPLRAQAGAVVTGRGGEAPSTPSSEDDRPRPRSGAAPTRCAAGPDRSAPAPPWKGLADSGAGDSSGQPGRRASCAGARSPAATTTDAPSPATRQTGPPLHAATHPAPPPSPPRADQQVRASHYRAHSSEPPRLSSWQTQPTGRLGWNLSRPQRPWARHLDTGRAANCSRSVKVSVAALTRTGALPLLRARAMIHKGAESQ